MTDSSSENRAPEADLHLGAMTPQRRREAASGRGAMPIQYTAFIRMPFPRGDFVDPPLVDWDADKDHALWQILFRSSRSADLNWTELCVHFLYLLKRAILAYQSGSAAQFDVTVPFILQQAAWLYERQFSQVRAQMLRAASDSQAPTTAAQTESPTLVQPPPPGELSRAPFSYDGVVSATAEHASNLRPVPGSSVTPGDAANRSRSSSLRECPQPQSLPMSRSPSSNIVIPRRASPALPQANVSARKNLHRASVETLNKPQTAGEPLKHESVSSSTSPSSSDGEDEDKPEGRGLSASRALRHASQRPHPFKRPSRFGPPMYRSTHHFARGDGIGHEEEEDDRPFLAFQQQPLAVSNEGNEISTSGGAHNAGLSATLRTVRESGSPGAAAETSTSSPSSSNPSVAAPMRQTPRPFISSPASSPEALRGQRQAGSARSGAAGGASRAPASAARTTSDGTPSMGSSFSDLDDASVTQSALEEALLSNMQREGGAGSVASRASSGAAARALRSRR